jgi:hypothetical protein
MLTLQSGRPGRSKAASDRQSFGSALLVDARISLEFCLLFLGVMTVSSENNYTRCNGWIVNFCSLCSYPT